jgi:NaMN:DMB phosphoribosyltransferase
MVVATWVGVFVAYAAVWKASEELGLATWWLGPRADPQPLIVRLGPFIVAVVFGLLAIYNVRRLPILGLVGAAVLAAIAVPDLWRSIGLATVEFAIAGAVVLVSAASFTGTYRRARSDHAR